MHDFLKLQFVYIKRAKIQTKKNSVGHESGKWGG